MRRRSFILFVAPSLLMMALFIAGPLIMVAAQSLYQTRTLFHDTKVETCTPGFLAPVCVTESRSVPALDAAGRPLTRIEFVGFEAYRRLLETDRIVAALAPGGGGLTAILRIDFFRALRFTLTFTLLTLPLVIGLGLAIAIAVDALGRAWRGPVIFATLLPFIVTPVVGALSIRWLFLGDGILTRFLESLLARDIALFAQGWTIEILMLVYRVWHVAPFAFVVFYAGLQTVDRDTLESAIVDGASRSERLWHVIVPHLAPLIVFVALIHLMDGYRVFDEIIGFSSQAHVISLQWLTFQLLTPDETGNRAIGRASASSVLTMIGIAFLLAPLLRRTWREHRERR
jgi:multiple sugar transport system permease protein